jgi:hypothetical protein
MGRIEIIGSSGVIAGLLAIPQQARRALERTVLKDANELVVDALRARIAAESTETGALKKSITSDIRKYKGGNVLVGLVGAKYDYVGTVQRNKSGKKVFKKNKNAAENVRRPANYFHFVELGTQTRQTKDGKNRGSVTGTHVRDKVMAQLASQIETMLSDAVWT